MKEEKELDKVLQPLLSAMGLALQIQPKKGVMQHGLDLYATKRVGGITEHYLITVKKGDISRSEWNKENSGCRDSLNELLEVNEHTIRGSSKAGDQFFIILCLGGELGDDVKQSWLNYKSKHTENDREFLLWNGEFLTSEFNRHLLNESILPEELVPGMRRALVYLNEIDYDLSHYKSVLNSITNKFLNSSSLTERKRYLSFINVILHLIHIWAQKENNLKPALRAAELSVLEVWKVIKSCELEEDKKIMNWYEKIFGSYLSISSDYITKCYPNYFLEFGVSRQCTNSFTSSLVFIEELGILAVHGIIQAMSIKGIESRERQEQISNNVLSVRDAIKAVIINNSSCSTIYYDGHYIEIMLVIFFLNLVGDKETVDEYLIQILSKLHHTLARKENFPISSDNYNEFLDYKFGKSVYDISDLFDSSCLIPCLAYYCAWDKKEADYKFINEHILPLCEDTTFQYWFPLKEDYHEIFSTDIYQNGVGFVSKMGITKEILLEDVDQYYIERESNNIKFSWECFDYFNSLLASRSLRKPLIPPFWAYRIHDLINKKS